MKQGLVIKNTGSWYVVRADDGAEINCKIKGNLRLKGFRCTNPVTVGDVVTLEPKPDGTAFINAIEPRRNYIIRRASNLSKEFQIIASNLDMALLVATLAEPATSTTFIDRFLATAMAYRVPVTLLINKTDLLTTPDDRELLEAFVHLYRSIGYEVLTSSAATGDGIEELRAALAGKTTLLSGNSGVGKSSLINRLVPGACLRVGEVSAVHHTGMHTTTFSEMLDLPGGGCLIDTPGVKGFGTIDLERDEVSHFFPEIFERARDCRYGNCTHTHEPGCAVREAVDASLISLSRYTSYLSIMDDTNPDKYRKPF
ncbi:MAG: ribosome small subunit-dependent GTPase A [Muribaculaceae bacterium]|nr:ribosome small subunit-dependent GTPase A [Muribaculaceae bacterium]